MGANVIALYKTWKGEDFVDASIESIYNHVTKIVFVNSDISWDGTPGPNTVRPVVERWQSRSDNINKIVHINKNCTSQNEQYRVGMDYIKNNIEFFDFIMLIDTDEVWDDADLERAKAYLEDEKNKKFNAFCCELHTYIKSPFYRINPPEYCRPTVFVRRTCSQEIGIRGVSIVPKLYMPDVHMHHFTMVRNSDSDLKHKVKLSHIGDGVESVPIDNWFKEKWDKLGKSDVTNFHYTKRFEQSWKGIIKVTKADLPKVFSLSNKPIIQRFEYEEKKDIVERHKLSYELVKLDSGSFNLDTTRKSVEYGLIKKYCKNEAILEIGTLNGRNLLCMAQDGYSKLTGIEFIPEAIAYGVEKAKELGLGIRFVLGSYPNEYLLKEKFDKIIVFDTLEHVTNVGFFIEAIVKNISDNGEALFLVPANTSYRDPVHINFYPDLDALRLILSMHMEIEEAYPVKNGTKLFARCKKR